MINKIVFLVVVIFIAASQPKLIAQTVENGRFILYKYQRAMGVETYEIKRDGDDLILDTKFGLSFIGALGGEFALSSTLRLEKDTLRPKHFVTKGNTSTRTSVDVEVGINGQNANVRYNFGTNSRPVPKHVFTILQQAPIAPQMMFFRYWKKNKIGKEIPLLPT